MSHRVPRVPTLSCTSLLVLSLLGCSAQQNASPPVIESEERLQPSGGVSGGPLADSLTVFAIDAATNQALSGAHVILGSGADAHEVGVTGSDGRVEISGLGPV